MQGPNISLRPHFAVPIAEVEVPHGEDIARDLIPLFLARENDQYRNAIHRDTQHGALFESKFDVFTWPDEPVRRMAESIHSILGSVVKQLNNYSDEQFQALNFQYHAWYHITRNGGYQGTHNHPNASWSGIFCVDPGDEVAGRPDNGVVRFIDPRESAYMYIDAGNGNLQTPYHSEGYQISHRAGRLVLFPSYIMHEVFPYVGQRERIIVAFNCWIHERARRT